MSQYIINMNHLVIGFAAPKGTGKDTTARRLKHPHRGPDGVTKAGPWLDAYQAGALFTDSFAEPLYRVVAILTGLSVEQLQDPVLKEVTWQFSPDDPEIAKNLRENPTNFTARHTAPTATLVGWGPRKLLEVIGTQWVRDQLGRAHWIQLMKARLARHSKGITLITDVRFPNEANLCDLVVELQRDGKDYDERPDHEGGHESRRRLPECFIDYTCRLTEDMNYTIFAEDLLQKADIRRKSGRYSHEIEERRGWLYGPESKPTPTPCKHCGKVMYEESEVKAGWCHHLVNPSCSGLAKNQVMPDTILPNNLGIGKGAIEP